MEFVESLKSERNPQQQETGAQPVNTGAGEDSEVSVSTGDDKAQRPEDFVAMLQRGSKNPEQIRPLSEWERWKFELANRWGARHDVEKPPEWMAPKSEMESQEVRPTARGAAASVAMGAKSALESSPFNLVPRLHQSDDENWLISRGKTIHNAILDLGSGLVNPENAMLAMSGVGVGKVAENVALKTGASKLAAKEIAAKYSKAYGRALAGGFGAAVTYDIAKSALSIIGDKEKMSNMSSGDWADFLISEGVQSVIDYSMLKHAIKAGPVQYSVNPETRKQQISIKIAKLQNDKKIGTDIQKREELEQANREMAALEHQPFEVQSEGGVHYVVDMIGNEHSKHSSLNDASDTANLLNFNSQGRLVKNQPLLSGFKELLEEHKGETGGMDIVTDDVHEKDTGQRNDGGVAFIDRERGRVVINRAEFNNHIHSIEPSKRAGAVKALLNEEHIHKIVQDDDAAALWGAMSWHERQTVKHAYGGGRNLFGGMLTKMSPKETDGKTPEQVASEWEKKEAIAWGHEAARMQLQRLRSGATTETEQEYGGAGSTRRRLSIKAVGAIAKVISGIKGSISKAPSDSQIIFRRIVDNYDAETAGIHDESGAAPTAEQKAPSESEPFQAGRGKQEPDPNQEIFSALLAKDKFERMHQAVREVKDGEIGPIAIQAARDVRNNNLLLAQQPPVEETRMLFQRGRGRPEKEKLDLWSKTQPAMFAPIDLAPLSPEQQKPERPAVELPRLTDESIKASSMNWFSGIVDDLVKGAKFGGTASPSELASRFSKYAARNFSSAKLSENELAEVYSESMVRELMSRSGSELESMLLATFGPESRVSSWRVPDAEEIVVKKQSAQLALDSILNEAKSDPYGDPNSPVDIPEQKIRDRMGAARYEDPHNTKLRGSEYDAMMNERRKVISDLRLEIPVEERRSAMRAKAVSMIAKRLLRPLMEDKIDLERTDIKPDEILVDHRGDVAPLQVFSAGDTSEADFGARITSRWRRSSAENNDITRRQTVIIGEDGRTHRVSTWRNPDNEVFLADPDSPTGGAMNLNDALKRYKFHSNFLILDPNRRVVKTWDSLKSYMDDFGSRAERNYNRESEYDPNTIPLHEFMESTMAGSFDGGEGPITAGVEEGNLGMAMGPMKGEMEMQQPEKRTQKEKSMRVPIQRTEAEALARFIGDVETVHDLRKRLGSLRDASSARKAYLEASGELAKESRKLTQLKAKRIGITGLTGKELELAVAQSEKISDTKPSDKESEQESKVASLKRRLKSQERSLSSNAAARSAITKIAKRVARQFPNMEPQAQLNQIIYRLHDASRRAVFNEWMVSDILSMAGHRPVRAAEMPEAQATETFPMTRSVGPSQVPIVSPTRFVPRPYSNLKVMPEPLTEAKPLPPVGPPEPPSNQSFMSPEERRQMATVSFAPWENWQFDIERWKSEFEAGNLRRPESKSVEAIGASEAEAERSRNEELWEMSELRSRPIKQTPLDVDAYMEEQRRLKKQSAVKTELFQTGRGRQEPLEIGFTTKAMLMITDPKEYGMSAKETIDGSKTLLALSKQLKPAEWDILKRAGIADRFSGRQIAREELVSFIQQNQPKVKVLRFGESAISENKKALNKITHEWFDALSQQDKNILWGVNNLDSLKTLHGWDDSKVATAKEYRRLEDATRDEGRPPSVNWDWVAPKAEEDMSGYVEIAVVKPLGKEHGEVVNNIMAQGASRARAEELATHEKHGIQFPSSHRFPPNTLGFVRGYMETGSEGEKIFNVIEAQSDWHKEVSKLKDVAKKHGADTDGGWHQRKLDEMSHPLLDDYERIVLKASIQHALKEGATHIAVIDAETAMIMEGHDRDLVFKDGVYKDQQTGDELHAVNDPDDISGSYVVKPNGKKVLTSDLPEQVMRRWAEVVGRENTHPRTESGMRHHYDGSAQNTMSKLTGYQGKTIDFGEHKNALSGDNPRDWTQGERNLTKEEAQKKVDAVNGYAVKRPIGFNEAGKEMFEVMYKGKYRENLFFRNTDGSPKTSVTARIYPLDRINGESQVLFQQGRGIGESVVGLGSYFASLTGAWAMRGPIMGLIAAKWDAWNNEKNTTSRAIANEIRTKSFRNGKASEDVLRAAFALMQSRPFRKNFKWTPEALKASLEIEKTDPAMLLTEAMIKASSAQGTTGAELDAHSLKMFMHENMDKPEFEPMKGVMVKLMASINKGEADASSVTAEAARLRYDAEHRINNNLVEKGLLKHDTAEYTFDESSKERLIEFGKKIDRAIIRANEALQMLPIGERARTREWLKDLKEHKQDLEYAVANFGAHDLRDVTMHASKLLDEQFDREVADGGTLSYNDGYVPGRYDGQFYNNSSVSFGPQVLGRGFSQAKAFLNYYEAADRGYIAATHNAADLVEHRLRQGMAKLGRSAWEESMFTIIDPMSGIPAYAKAVLDSRGNYKPQLQKGTDANNYEPVSQGGSRKPIYALKGSYSRLARSLTGSSGVLESTPARIILKTQLALKHVTLVGDIYHMFKMKYLTAAASCLNALYGDSHTPALSLLEFREKGVEEAVKKGALDKETAEWMMGKVPFKDGESVSPITRIEAAQRIIASGFNAGNISDAIYKELVGTVPFIGKQAERYNKFLFDRLSRGLMMKAAMSEYERLSARSPEANSSQLMRQISKDLNAHYGALGTQGLIKSRTWQDISRIIFFAPQWSEGIVRRDLAIPYKLATSLRHGVRGPVEVMRGSETAARAIARGMLGMMVLTQGINLITRGQPTWKNKEKEHQWDAYIGNGVFISFLSVFNETLNDIVRLGETTPDLWSKLVHIGENKLNFLGRASLVAAQGGSFRRTMQQFAPVPITFGSTVKSMLSSATGGRVSPVPPEEMRRSQAGILGFKAEVAPSPIQRALNDARKFALDNKLITKADYKKTISDDATYYQLRRALMNNDTHGAAAMLAGLRNSGHTDEKIAEAMHRWKDSTFTGKNQAEIAWLRSLDENGRAEYREAVRQKIELYSKWLSFYVNHWKD
jgi:hypothetical protein